MAAPEWACEAISYPTTERFMKLLRYAILSLSLCWPVAASAKPSVTGDFFPVCEKFPEGSGRTLTVDPQGRAANALPNLPAALKAARPGDTIALTTGDYGDFTLTGANQGGFITLAAASGQTPRFTRLTIGTNRDRASHWRLTGLTVSGFGNAGKWQNGGIIHRGLVAIGNSDNIIFDGNAVNSRPGQIEWKSEEDAFAANETLSGGVSVNQGSCISISDNHITNVFNGIMFGGDPSTDNGKYYVVSDNLIDDFTGDGIDHFASHVRIERNRITNGHDICESKCVHMDGIQGWNWNNKPGLLNVDVQIDGNTIIAQTRPGLAMPAGTLQGITIFDGNWDGVRIFNNLVIATAWHGITSYNAKNVQIVNNTVAGTDPKHNTWIGFKGRKNDPPGTAYNITIRNNVARTIAVGKPEMAFDGVVVDHNLVLRDADDYADNFEKFDLARFAFDLHPRKRSDATGEGSPENAPATDIEGKPRQAPIDIGAYVHQGQ